MVSYLLNELEALPKQKLADLLFDADVLNFEKATLSISGLPYTLQDENIVPDHLTRLLDEMVSEKKIIVKATQDGESVITAGHQL